MRRPATRWSLALLVTVVVGLCGTREARAQGALVQGGVAATDANGHASPTVSGAITYRFNQVLGLGVELSHIRSFDGNNLYPYYCCSSEHGHVTTFTTNVRVEIPTLSNRVIPFVVGGGGMSAITQSYDVYYAIATTVDPAALAALNLVSPTIRPGPSPLSYTTSSMVLTLGGGASVLVSEHVSIDADLRALHLLGDNTTRTLGRFGGGVSYRF